MKEFKHVINDPMGIPGLDEWHIQQTDAQNIRDARLALDA